MMHFQCKINILFILDSPGGGVTLKREIFSVYGEAISYVARSGERSVNGGGQRSPDRHRMWLDC